MTERDAELAKELGRAATEEPSVRSLARVATQVGSSARQAGVRAVASGRWLADVGAELATHLPIRDAESLRDQHGGREGPELAGVLIRNASRTSAAVGAAVGGLVGVQETAPPSWPAIPAELLLETLVVAAIEMKLVAELHEVYGRPVTGPPSARGAALARAWAEGRGVRITDLAKGAALSDLFGHGARRELTRLLRRRMLRRLGRHLTALAPLLTGAVAAAEVNRRGTIGLAEAVVRDLAAPA